MSAQLKEDCITDKLAWAVCCKGILSLSFSHQQTWLERRSVELADNHRGPFSTLNIYICSLPLMDLETSNQFECGLRGMHQSTDLWIHNERNEGDFFFVRYPTQIGPSYLACKSKTGRVWHHLRESLEGGFFDVLGYLRQAGRPTILERHQAFWCQLISAGHCCFHLGN